MKRAKPLLYIIFFLISVLSFPPQSYAAEYKILKTKHAKIHYNQDKDLGDFIWRISGKRINQPADFSLAKSAVDRIIERVQSILDMFPDNFHIAIFLHPTYKDGDIALYKHKARALDVYVDRVTDGVLAHEIAHAIINSYFDVPPPKKVQEILSQYVDRHLWSDY